MIFLIITLILFAIALISAFSEYSILLSITTLTLAVALIVISMFPKDMEYYKSTEYKIYGMQDNSFIKGKFHFRHGYIDEQMYYTCMRDMNGGKIMVNFPSNRSYIFEEENIEPYAEIYEERYANNIWNILIGGQVSSYKYYIHVNAGTISYDNEIDLKE